LHAQHTSRVLRPRCPRSHLRASDRSGAHALVCRSGGGRGVMILFWLVRSLVVQIFGLCCLGVRNFGFTVFWLAGCLGVRIPGFTVTLDLRILQHIRISGSLCGCLLRVVWFFGFSWVTWHAGSCFSAVYDASTRLGHSNECSLYVQ
jgi:hypothetical protein